MSAQYYIDDSIATSDKNNNAPGTGMYYINNITTTEIELKKNEEWRDLIKDSDEEQMLDSSTKDTEESSKKNLSLDTVLIKIYTSMGEAYNAFKMGNLDMIMTQSLNYQEYIGTLGYNVKEYIGREYDYLAFNCENNILKNKEIRQAINYAIDKSNIIASVFENNYYVTDYPINTNHFLYKTEKVSSSYNTNKSEEILQNAGWEFKNGIWQKTENYYTTKAKIDLVVNESNEKRVQVAENIKKQLEDFGITINIIKASQSQYERYLENKNYDMILTGKKIGVSPTLESYVGTNNLSNFSDQEVDEILDEIANLSDNQEEMEKKYNSLLKLIEEEQPYVSLYFDKYTLIYRQDLQGNINPNFYNVFYNIENWVRQY
jgi:peptide/nickel transport system substrate-binding protein